MPHEESRYPRDWLRIAEKDWRRIGHALDDDDADEAGFWLQQAVEKFLKAYLLSRGWSLRKVHDLEVLINEATEHVPEFMRYAKACRKISGYYIAERYPLIGSTGLTAQEVSHSRDEVLSLVDLIRRELG